MFLRPFDNSLLRACRELTKEIFRWGVLTGDLNGWGILEALRVKPRPLELFVSSLCLWDEVASTNRLLERLRCLVDVVQAFVLAVLFRGLGFAVSLHLKEKCFVFGVYGVACFKICRRPEV